MMAPVLILYGVLSFANPGVLEHVAENRAAGLTAITVSQNWAAYDVLLAVEDCRFVGTSGTLHVDNGIRLSALVVDCQNAEHRESASMTELGLLADVNRKDIVHHKAIFLMRQSEERKKQ